MPKNRMLIDASHEEGTRVVVMKNNRVEEFDFESAARKLLKGSIYLAKITRVEPSLQAAFVDFGGNRHGFLAFNEVHPDYYQIPHADRQALLEAEAAANRDDDDDDDDIDAEDGDDETGVVEVDDDDDDDDVTPDDEEGDGDDRTDADVADISVASQKARDIDDAVAVEAADLAARERDGGITAAASETRADSDTAEAALPSDVDGHMPVAEPTPEIESDDAKFA
ncbi:MAG: ribonuclease E/G, partial [Pseudomonadota bacterium]